ncbi:MAG: hypothetical protein HQL37_01270 [Alphaproteobacteria bacterium]|nr:hypothetical protein [Alphaproteobacteria bacterium]
MVARILLAVRRLVAAVPGLRRLFCRSPALQALDLLFRRMLRSVGRRGMPMEGTATVAAAREAALFGDLRRAVDIGAAVVARSCGDPAFHRSLVDWVQRTGEAGTRAQTLWQALSADAALVSGRDRDALAALLTSVGLEILSHNGLSASLRFLRLAGTLSPTPDRAFCTQMCEFLVGACADAAEAGQTLASASAPPTVFGYVVWGSAYVDAFMKYHIRSLLAPGNLPALTARRLVVSIVTTPEDRARIVSHQQFAALARHAEVHFSLVSGHLCARNNSLAPDQLFYRFYGALDHINLHFAGAAGADVFLLPVDCLVADGSIRAMTGYLAQGYDSCGGANIVAKTESFLPALDAVCPGDGPIVLDTRRLASLALKHCHQYTASQWMVRGNRSFGRWPRELFWPVKGGVVAHSIYTHPLFISARALGAGIEFPYSSADFLLTARIFQDRGTFRRFRVISDASEAYISNFTSTHRRFEETDRPFDPRAFAAAHRGAYPIHRHMFCQRQFVPTLGGEAGDRDPDADMAVIQAQLGVPAGQQVPDF